MILKILFDNIFLYSIFITSVYSQFHLKQYVQHILFAYSFIQKLRISINIYSFMFPNQFSLLYSHHIPHCKPTSSDSYPSRECTLKLRSLSNTTSNPEMYGRQSKSPPQLVVFNNKKFITNLSPQHRETIRNLPRKLSCGQIPLQQLIMKEKLKNQQQKIQKAKYQVSRLKQTLKTHKQGQNVTKWSPIDAIRNLQISNTSKGTQQYEKNKNRMSEQIIQSIDLIPFNQPIFERPQQEEQQQCSTRQAKSTKRSYQIEPKSNFFKTQNKIDLDKNYSLFCQTEQSSTKNKKSVEQSLIGSQMELSYLEHGENKKQIQQIVNLTKNNQELSDKLEQISKERDYLKQQNEQNKLKIKEILAIVKSSQNQSQILRQKISHLQKNKLILQADNKRLKKNNPQKNECKRCDRLLKSLYEVTERTKINF